MSVQLTPAAYAREAERLAKMSKLAWAERDERMATRLARLAKKMERRAH